MRTAEIAIISTVNPVKAVDCATPIALAVRKIPANKNAYPGGLCSAKLPSSFTYPRPSIRFSATGR